MKENEYNGHEHTMEEIDAAAEKSYKAFLQYRLVPAGTRAAFLRSIGRMIETDSQRLAGIAQAETSLDHDRLMVEITRTVNQCFLFAGLLEEGSWVRAIIDRAEPERKPLPRPDLRQMQVALGPVAVFGASNFPFAYSVCGGDTVAAFAAGCSVVYKVNPGHPRTSDAVNELVLRAVATHQIPEGMFSIIHGTAHETGSRLVMHPRIKAVGFTGSLKGGRALYDAAAKRPEPIPVYAEMGSTNPVFILPRMAKEKNEEIASKLAVSNTSSAGQFCTKPGIMVSPEETHKEFLENYSARVRIVQPSAMLTPGILKSFQQNMSMLEQKDTLSLVARSEAGNDNQTSAYVFHSSAADFLGDREIWEEMFGPGSIQVSASGKQQMLEIAEALTGQLTASVWGTDEDLAEYADLLNILQLKAGRIIINGVPTGVEVCAAMNHGGPYPATTDSKFTSVGTQSIYRFTRPVCYQNHPNHLLPDELKDENPLGIVRLVDGAYVH